MHHARRTLSILAATVALTVGLASSSHDLVEVATATHDVHGTYLVDGDGASLYLFTSDTQGEASTCTGDCSEAWPPLTVDGEIGFGDGVSLDLLGTVEREDGAHQVTYDGWPLYAYADDQEPGDVQGHGLGDAWFLIRPDGDAVEATEDDADADGDSDADAGTSLDPEVMEAGQEVFRNICSECHGNEGGGGLGPRLVGHDVLADTSDVARQIIRGSGYMPAFGDRLSDVDITSVMTFVRNSWGNDYGSVTPEEVSEVR